MAKIKVHPRPGALSELLKTKGMTKMDAKEKTQVDRKTLSKIDRGEEVKLETLQRVVNKLQVTEEYFRHPPVSQETDKGDDPEPGTILLRKLDASRLHDLVEGTECFKWHLNAKVRDDDARKFLEDFEEAAEKFRKQNAFVFDDESHSLRLQLDRLKTADDMAARLERLAEHRLALLGGGHLFWECSVEEHSYEDVRWQTANYRSSYLVHLSIEPLGTQSRRVHIYVGETPPLFAPSDRRYDVFVNGRQLPKIGDGDVPSPRTLEDGDIPF
ncbi:helix-turn-helix domain-containing protein [Bradyrhizobium sp. RDI18]|uniref:helix-turn-helix domain-containing protein n=1 Tax=Bradyrhizobium sp. RDI18 TaxID=3367400 RepID=UPI00372067D0